MGRSSKSLGKINPPDPVIPEVTDKAESSQDEEV